MAEIQVTINNVNRIDVKAETDCDTLFVRFHEGSNVVVVEITSELWASLRRKVGQAAPSEWIEHAREATREMIKAEMVIGAEQ